MTSPWCTSRRKRAMDVVLASALLIPLSPFLGVAAGLVRVFVGGPVFFRQTRAGIRGEDFLLYKFRTMSSDCDSDGVLLPEEQRVTSLGRWMRATSVDELPQLIHVVRGQMSLVGPRPLIPRYVPRYSQRQARRLLVRPGLTGLAQVSGRNALTWDDRFELDVQYVETATFLLDLRILLATLKKVVRPEEVGEGGVIWSPEFFGPGTEVPIGGTAGGHISDPGAPATTPDAS